MFTGYVVYELSIYFISSKRLSTALAGFASFYGKYLLVIGQQIIIELIKRKFNII